MRTYTSGLLAAISLFFLLPAVACKSQKPVQAGTSKSIEDRLPNALLWRIEGNELTAPSYLFGTIHMIPREDFFLPPGLDTAFASTDEVIFEIDMADMTDFSSLMSLFSNIMMKGSVTIKSLLSEDEYKEVSDYFDRMGLPMFMLNRVKPMFLSMLVETNMTTAPDGASDIVSYEMELFNQATTGGKKTGGLETMEYQMSLFDSIPYRDQATMLLDAVRGLSGEDDQLGEIIALYKRQDIEAMSLMIGESIGEGDFSMENVLLHTRNHNWIPVMEAKMKQHPCFFAVGAGHLGGEEGVVRLLRNAGYMVEPVSNIPGK